MKNSTCLLLVVLLVTPYAYASLATIRGLLHNAVGSPVIHMRQEWVFDPEEGARRSSLYQQVNGRLGEKAIERIGLGIDGRHEQRLIQQRTRDQGHLGGLNAQLP